ncbi:MAG TPA: branched-chain amino acid ABC transporter ATP-binding protein/permease [Candidatus Methylomirabilis sp.]|nr:branched-chain amino acid ABC transporter ATP-binding protein/permease [Candidatus Methylomirabilis sp.]
MSGKNGQGLKRPRWIRPLSVGLFLLAAAGLGPLLSEHLITVAITTLFMILLSVAWNLALGYGGQFSLGHSVFLGVGAYTSTVLYTKLGLTPWIGMVASGLLASAVAVLLSLVAFRYEVRGVYFALLTLASAEVFRGLASSWDFINGPVGILLTMKAAPGEFLFLDRLPYYYAILSLVGLGLAITAVLERSRFGYALMALREDELAAETTGVDTYRSKVAVMGLSAFLTGLGGCFYAQFYLYISPEIGFAFEHQLNMLMGTMIGGAGTLWGPVVGTTIFSSLSELMRSLPFQSTRAVATASKMVYAGLLMLIIIYLPGGIMSLRLRRTARPAPAPPVPAVGAPAIIRPASGKGLLELEGVTKRFGGLTAVEGVSLAVHPGEVVGMIGPNGAGKTTLFNLVCGIYAPEAGHIRFQGEEITGLKPHEICRRGVGRTFQITKPFLNLDVLASVTIGTLTHAPRLRAGEAEAHAILEQVGLADRSHTLGKSLTVAERRRLELARALATRPRLLLLDEVAAGLNPTELAEIVALVRAIAAEGMGILFVEHAMQAVMGVSDRVVVISSGRKIAEERPAVVAQDPAVIDAYLGEAYVLAAGG